MIKYPHQPFANKTVLYLLLLNAGVACTHSSWILSPLPLISARPCPSYLLSMRLYMLYLVSNSVRSYPVYLLFLVRHILYTLSARLYPLYKLWQQGHVFYTCSLSAMSCPLHLLPARLFPIYPLSLQARSNL